MRKCAERSLTGSQKTGRSRSAGALIAAGGVAMTGPATNVGHSSASQEEIAEIAGPGTSDLSGDMIKNLLPAMWR